MIQSFKGFQFFFIDRCDQLNARSSFSLLPLFFKFAVKRQGEKMANFHLLHLYISTVAVVSGIWWNEPTLISSLERIGQCANRRNRCVCFSRIDLVTPVWALPSPALPALYDSIHSKLWNATQVNTVPAAEKLVAGSCASLLIVLLYTETSSDYSREIATGKNVGLKSSELQN